MQIRPELQLIINILRNEIRNSNYHFDKFTNSLSHHEINWDNFLQLIIRHRIIPQAYDHLKDKDYTPKNVLIKISNLYQNIRMQNLSMLGETLKITRELQNNDIKYIIIKGLPLGQIAYGDYFKRQAKDIDLLIDPKDLEKAQNIIVNLGFTTKYPTYELQGFKRTYYLSHQHEIVLFNKTNSVEVELHFNLNYLGLKFFDFNDIPEQSININNHTIKSTINIFHLIYLMIHGSTHAFFRIRWLHDIALYITNTDVDLNKVFALAKLLNTEHIMLQTLLLIQKVYGINNPTIEEIILKYGNKKSKELADIAMAFILDSYELTNNNGIFNKMFFKYRFYLGKIAANGQKINAIIGDLFKIEKTFPYIKMPKYMSLGYYLYYPFIALRYFRK